jgi:hypothetical protein
MVHLDKATKSEPDAFHTDEIMQVQRSWELKMQQQGEQQMVVATSYITSL